MATESQLRNKNTFMLRCPPVSLIFKVIWTLTYKLNWILLFSQVFHIFHLHREGSGFSALVAFMEEKY